MLSVLDLVDSGTDQGGGGLDREDLGLGISLAIEEGLAVAMLPGIDGLALCIFHFRSML